MQDKKKETCQAVKLCVHGMQSLRKICTVCCISSYFGVSKAIYFTRFKMLQVHNLYCTSEITFSLSYACKII
jgi:hypothetical protein